MFVIFIACEQIRSMFWEALHVFQLLWGSLRAENESGDL